jgi:manganese/zinc/iron transport system ATP- binding protein
MHVHTLQPVKQSTNGGGNKSSHESSTQPVLELSHITAGYGDSPAIVDVTATIRHGKRVALIGPNGAGKSTLFRTIVGLLTPIDGQVLIHGSPNTQARQHTAYVPQFEDVDWDFPVSVLDVVVMALSRQVGWLRLPGRYHKDISCEALRRVNMLDYANRQIGELSGGQKRRVFIARALAQGADILLLDEPFSGVDAYAQQTMFEILDQLRDEGVTVLLATHDLHLVSSKFDELFILNKRLIAYGSPEDVFKPEIMAGAFGGQIAIWQQGEQVIMLTDHHCQ